MKKLVNIFLGMLLITVGFNSCEVERFPFDQIEQTQAYNTMGDAESLMNGMYAQLRNRMYGVHMYTADIQADQFNAGAEFGNRGGAPHTWGENFLANDYNIRDNWAGVFTALSNVNSAITNFPNIETESEEEAQQLEEYIGAAHLLRALYYHRLVIRFAKPYDPSTASSELGVPLVLEYDPAGKPERATVQQVYDQIISDIDEAKLRLGAGSPMSPEFSFDAALALESRVLLHMHDWDGAITSSQELINTGRYPLVNSLVGLENMWVNDNSSSIITQLTASVNELPDAVNNIYLGYVPAVDKYNPDFIPQQWVVDLYEDDDYRKEVYLSSLVVTMSGNDYNDIYLLNKYPGNPELRAAGANTNYQHKPIVFRIAETYLNLAEAQYRDGDEGGALTTINALRVTRGVEELTGLTGEPLFVAIQDERTRELIGEGFRLNDLMRWGKGFDRGQVQEIEILTTGGDYQDLSIPADHPKFVWGIPTNDLTTNPNMVQNPGW